MHDLKLTQIVLKNTLIYSLFIFFKLIFAIIAHHTFWTLRVATVAFISMYFRQRVPQNFTNHLEPIISSKDTFCFCLHTLA